ncbi:MAG: tetratricopeptide repeat protein [Candidatus Cloacimonetes bacterium]|jgi:tetratricopeptide (TPR) repeat protein|nr:tetratricopeptide repeat protein [Candidatus Cloacimonadota bacterium]MBT6994912.1 tetratricopeptide repeat protein [Candidatus Cloacimonadota bacterium]MBT7469513.1 tetratricopeptide repeat protein [Candidatus Cloacimonadota bacterium]
MIKKIVLLSILLTVAITTFAQVNEIYNNAVENYKQHKFSEALDLFLQIERSGNQNADLTYNIGNCYFRLENLGKAILYFKKSLKIDSTHKTARRNLEYALTLTKDVQNNANFDDAVRSFWHKTFDSFSLNLLAIIMLIIFAFIIFIIIHIVLFFGGREKNVPIFILIILIVIFIIFVFLFTLKNNAYQSENEAVIISHTTIGYSGPSAEFTRVFTIHEGMICQIEKTENEWSLIKLNNGIGGWILTENLEKILIK